MFDLTLHQLHEIVNGRLRLATLPPRDGESARIGRVVTDTRHLAPGDVFWGLVGPRFDGSDFATEAYERGAAGVVVAGRYVQPWPGRWSLQVDDGLSALTRLAAWNREQFAGTVIAVTGSVGKTTTRQMVYAVLAAAASGIASRRNLNNQVGVPLSMLALRPDHEFAVFELAASAPGEIAQLAALCRPEVGVITRVGEAHLEGFGSPAAVAEAKAELLAALPLHGAAVLSGDDVWLRRMAAHSRAQITWVGRSLDCNLVATQVESRQGRLTFCVDGHPYDVPVWGRHHLTGALAAIAVGRKLGMSRHDIARGLAEFQPPPMRCEVVQAGDVMIINDTYNASPTAMRAALELLRDFDAPGRRIVVCGDMRELGDQAEPLHRRLGEEVVTLCGADLLIACGEHAADVAAGARAAGMPVGRVVACAAPNDVLLHLDEMLEPGDVLLVKASRALALERVVAELQSRRADVEPHRLHELRA